MHQQAETVVAAADVLVSEAEVNAVYDRMAVAISAELAGKNPLIICTMMGGLQATAEITKRFKFAFELDYLHATRYRGELEGGDLLWKVSPSASLAGREVLVIDDILDEGHTLASIQACLQKQEPSRVLTAVLVKKMHDRRDPNVTADFVGMELEDRYLIGCGMDYRNYYRQLPYIAALQTEHC